MNREQHMAIGEAIGTLCNPDGSIDERVTVADLLRKAFELQAEHKPECAGLADGVEPEDAGYLCDCGYWDAIYPSDVSPGDFHRLNEVVRK